VDRKQERAFEEFVAESGHALLRLATLLTSDQGLGEDVYQETLHRLAARWSRVDNPLAYCRRVMHNIVIDRARTQQRRPSEIRLADAHDCGDQPQRRRGGSEDAAARRALRGAQGADEHHRVRRWGEGQLYRR
jgi:DNA-directed RNA polymerase specialized sigma24 family protein